MILGSNFRTCCATVREYKYIRNVDVDFSG